MFNKNIKLVLAALVLGLAIWQIIDRSIGNGIMLILLAAMFVLLYFKNEILILAFLRLRKQDFAGAQKWLDKIKNPEAALVRKQNGYYNYLNGLMLSQTNMIQSEKYFKHCTEEIRNEFVIKEKYQKEAREKFQVICGKYTTMISAHIRRKGHENPEHQNIHKFPPPSYYLRCIEYFSKRYKNIKFLLFNH